MAPLSTPFYQRPTEDVAKDLLGRLLCTRGPAGLTVGRIVETEAYTDDDPASHSYGRRKAHARGDEVGRSWVMFGPPGRAYVYRSYGIHACFNVVTEEEGRGCAVLIRALKPLLGLARMAERRFPNKEAWRTVDLCRGPGRLTQAMGITVEEHNGLRLDDTAGPVAILEEDDTLDGRIGEEYVEEEYGRVAVSQRIGITKGVEASRRFFFDKCRFVSGSRAKQLKGRRAPR